MTPDIGPCLTAINELALNPDAISNWQAVFSDQIFWTDAGKYFQFAPYRNHRAVFREREGVGRGLWTDKFPPDRRRGFVFSSLYILPDFLRTLAIFIAVAGSDDPNWVIDYGPQVLQPVAAFLKDNVHDTIATEIMQLSPGFWDGQRLWNAVGIPPLSSQNPWRPEHPQHPERGVALAGRIRDTRGTCNRW